MCRLPSGGPVKVSLKGRKKKKSKIMLTRQARQMEDTHETTHAKRDAASLGEWCMCDVAQ